MDRHRRGNGRGAARRVALSNRGTDRRVCAGALLDYGRARVRRPGPRRHDGRGDAHHRGRAQDGAAAKVLSLSGGGGIHERHRRDHLLRPAERIFRSGIEDARARAATNRRARHSPARVEWVCARDRPSLVRRALGLAASDEANPGEHRGGGGDGAGRLLRRLAHRDDREQIRRHPERPARVAFSGGVAGNDAGADGTGVYHRGAGRDRVAPFRDGRRRHGRHASRSEPGADRPGHREHPFTTGRWDRGHRRDRADGREYPKWRTHAGGGHCPFARPASGGPRGCAARFLHPARHPQRNPARGGGAHGGNAHLCRVMARAAHGLCRDGDRLWPYDCF